MSVFYGGLLARRTRKENMSTKRCFTALEFNLWMKVLHHLQLPNEIITEYLQNSITIPRVTPRMSSTLLTSMPEDRPQTILHGISNLGLVGPFTETREQSCLDIGYGADTAWIAIANIFGLHAYANDPSRPSAFKLLKILWFK